MKRKRYLKQFIYLLAFAAVMSGCEDDDGGPPPVENQPPEFSGLNDVTLSPGFETHEIDFANYVSDQEGEIIEYQVTNSDESVITISLQGSVLTISEVGPGTSEIGVTATDGHEGHEVTESFNVTVEAITGAADYEGNAVVMIDYNGFGTGSIFDNPVDGLLVEGWNYDWDEGPFGSYMLDNDDHAVITNNVDASWMWSEYELDGNQDCTGKKFRFDISFFTAPNLTDAYWEDDQSAVNIQIFFVDETWEESGGQYRFSALNLEYSPEWQAVEIPLADFESLWELPVDPSAVGVIGLEIWGGTESDPISFRLDNFGIVD
jgi:hypothetical protein